MNYRFSGRNTSHLIIKCSASKSKSFPIKYAEVRSGKLSAYNIAEGYKLVASNAIRTSSFKHSFSSYSIYSRTYFAG